jgi:squalene-hopene/tetraprenyl-beta-curcumene cyclase
MKLAFLCPLVATTLAASTFAQGMASGPAAEKGARPSANEPKAASFSLERSAEQIDRAAVKWTRQHKCGSCHTNYPFLMARPMLREFASPALLEVRAFFEKRVAHWGDPEAEAKPRWDAEVVSTAAALAINDAATTGALHPLTRKALDRVWTLQKPNGGWEWLKCGWPPLEHDDYYGALVVALGAGHAPDGYARGSLAQEGIERMRGYFRKTPPPDLHHQTVLLWASTRLEGIMDSEQKEATIRALRALQRSDGGWCLPSLGHWKRRDGKPNDPGSPSDGYATGLVVFVLREAGVPASDPAIGRGVSWLKANQRVSGRWFTRSLNDDKDHYIADAGTCYAVMALRRCESAAASARVRAAQAGQTDEARIVRVAFIQEPQARARSFKDWGDVVDPDGDCQIAVKGGKLSIGLPGTLYDLGVEVGQVNAPRVLRDVEGDFVAEVKVEGKFEPGGKCTRPGGFPYNGAGLLLWNDQNNYLRLERAAILRDGKLIPYVNFEERSNRRPSGGGASIPNEPVSLRLARRGSEITASVSTDGRSWHQLKTFTVRYPARVKVGVAAVNSASRPFEAEFEGFRVVAGSRPGRRS